MVPPRAIVLEPAIHPRRPLPQCRRRLRWLSSVSLSSISLIGSSRWYLDISHRYLSSVSHIGISRRYLLSVSHIGISYRYLSSVSLSGISPRYLVSVSHIGISYRYLISVSHLGISSQYPISVSHRYRRTAASSQGAWVPKLAVRVCLLG